ncbi:hypothetical protein SADFL11_00044550 [Roseibium alexandrii DFL-11]|uniref:Uncharacterized protein n=1 Tax=Roseibium alexandrii (strain DSM 17067 / NCIMB 14079 / DFL-11) TaxID=244592 RepID=A0A5E8UWQ0_ROSAD|nr:hypothetical protein SADFL11_00044550 [Roseibium alexandrii DFL-11]
MPAARSENAPHIQKRTEQAGCGQTFKLGKAISVLLHAAPGLAFTDQTAHDAALQF